MAAEDMASVLQSNDTSRLMLSDVVYLLFLLGIGMLGTLHFIFLKRRQKICIVNILTNGKFKRFSAKWIALFIPVEYERYTLFFDDHTILRIVAPIGKYHVGDTMYRGRVLKMKRRFKKMV